VTDSLIVVLHRPQRIANIGAVVRAMKNTGLRRLRLVAPAEFNAYDIEGIAHRSADLLAATTIHTTLDEALADTTFVVGTTARTHDRRVPLLTPRADALYLLERAAEGQVALLFGPEDNGLGIAELDRCHALLTIPVNPAYSSLNLAQAVLLVGYELWMAGGQVPSIPTHERVPAGAAQLEELFVATEQALWSIEFFKAHLAGGIMRSLRTLVYRAAPDVREAGLLRAIAMETLNYLRRTGRYSDPENS
jgi:TrmH family RNA methyltransferase